MSTRACGSRGADAGAAGVDIPGRDDNPGMDDNPGIMADRPDATGAAADPAGDGNPSADEAGNPAGAEAGNPAGNPAGSAEAADGTPGKEMPGEVGAAGGVAPSAVARLCRI
jgi:hypothetical protein